MAIDLRSDTVTHPSPGMREAISQAVVGDDVFGDDPTVNSLQRRVARLLGKDDALFVPSGTMANQLAIRSQTRPGEQLLVEDGSHIYRYEAGAPAVLSSLLLTTLPSEFGLPSEADFLSACNPDDIHCAPPALLCLENTHNRHGGRILPLEGMAALCAAAHDRGLRTHLDGARLWNASIATGTELAAWAQAFDSVSVCFSKGLGAPIGSVVAGSEELVARARRLRKLWGGGMRQVGILAAACEYALDHQFERLVNDHEHAKLLADSMGASWIARVQAPETNIVFVDLLENLSAAAVAAKLSTQGVLVTAMGPHRLRLVTHLGVSEADCKRAATAINELKDPR